MLDNNDITELYFIKKVHPSREHIIIPGKVKGNYIKSVKDNFVSQTNAILFDKPEAAQLFVLNLNTKCQTYICKLNSNVFQKVKDVGLKEMFYACKSNVTIHCFIVK